LPENVALAETLWQRHGMAVSTLTTLRVDQRVVLAVRTGLYVIGAALTLVQRSTGEDVVVVTLLLAVAIAASVPLPVSWRRIAVFQPVAEAVLACGAMLILEPLPETLLPYLIAPALAAGLAGGVQVAITAAGLSALVLMLGRLLGQETLTWSSYLGLESRWTLITLAVGLLGAWVGRLQQANNEPTENVAYAAAYRLISQLRLVARQLSGGLDPVSLGQQMLEQVDREVSFDRGAVYVRSSGGRLAPVTFLGADRLEWDVDSPLFDEAWASSTAMRSAVALTPGTSGFAAVLPLRIGLRTFGLIAIERSAGAAFEQAQLKAAEDILEELGLRLETALLFSEVRSLATAEERRRLAREIHDGIAQELASMGYVVDDLAARARYLPDLEADLKTLRSELTRVITELRLSIFDLRSEVQTTTGLGTALSDYVRQVGASSNLTVHLVLDETPMRLPIDSETELLRIAQEAVTNARKHANAHNLWVTCRIDPPSAYLAVSDDGSGLGVPRDDSFGLEVMRERAHRIGARLAVGNRPEGGTAVEVTLGAVRVAD
jgi:signal transduction histidine kinase